MSGSGWQCVAIGVKSVAQVTVVIFNQIEVTIGVQIWGRIHETHGRAEAPWEVGVDRERFEDCPMMVDCRHTCRPDMVSDSDSVHRPVGEVVWFPGIITHRR